MYSAGYCEASADLVCLFLGVTRVPRGCCGGGDLLDEEVIESEGTRMTHILHVCLEVYVHFCAWHDALYSVSVKRTGNVANSRATATVRATQYQHHVNNTSIAVRPFNFSIENKISIIVNNC